MVIPLKDTVESDLLSILPNVMEAIDAALDGNTINNPSKSGTVHSDDDNSKRVCLVMCAKGASRSVSVIIGYLLSRHSNRFKTFDDALKHVRTVRPMACPNIGFSLALRQFERELHQNA